MRFFPFATLKSQSRIKAPSEGFRCVSGRDPTPLAMARQGEVERAQWEVEVRCQRTEVSKGTSIHLRRGYGGQALQGKSDLIRLNPIQSNLSRGKINDEWIFGCLGK